MTDSQRQAVEHLHGPLLVLAGPGSGKTRVVTRRIARLIEEGIPSRQILAITFTNRAAAEMRERVESLVPESGAWISTFHRFCAHLLRKYAGVVGLAGNYTILDTGEQRTALRRVMSDLDLDTQHFSPDRIAHRISAAKNDLVTAELFARRFEETVGDHWSATVARVYPAYQKWLLDSNAVDFDDLLLHVATLLADNPEIRSQLDDRYRYILVDEYQDTNAAQYQIVAALSQRHPNLCVTGDPDQSIYGWRGARIENILRFERDYPTAAVVRLEDNFRSTKAILRASDRLIEHNVRRKAKTLRTGNPEGREVELLCFQDGVSEAEGLARRIREQVDAGDRTWDDFAVFFRVNSLSRQIEAALARNRIPFQVAAGVAFYERAEVKDLIGYLRLVYNPADRSAFLRIVNSPARGLGETSQQRLSRWAEEQGLNLVEAAARANEVPKLTRRAAIAFTAFARTISEFTLADAGSVEALLREIIERTGYIRAWEGSHNEDDRQRLENVQELGTAARLYDEALAGDATLEGFLEQTALVNETDAIDDGRGRVTLMTLHAAKGLEFPVVFIVAVEQGLLPHERVLKDLDGARELEEERRLLFVGMTRAREELYLTQTKERAIRGRTVSTIPSPFLGEFQPVRVDADLLEAGFNAWQVDAIRRARAGDGDTAAGPRNFDNAPLLTTAADLLKGTRTAAELPQGFARGMRVRHPQYGAGTVIDTGGFGHRRTVTVQFEKDRTEVFVASKAPLQPIGL